MSYSREQTEFLRLLDIESDELESMNIIDQVSLYKQVFEKVTDGIIVVNEYGRIIRVNDPVCQLLHLQKSDLLGKQINSLFSTIFIGDWDKQVQNLKNNKSDDLIVKLENGDVKHIELSFLQHKEKNLKIYQLKDISCCKKLKEEQLMTQNMFNDIFDQAVDGIIICDESGVIMNANPAFCQNIHLNKESVIGKPLSQFVPEKHQVKLEEIKRLLKQTGKATGIIPIQHCEGTTMYEYTISSYVFDGFYMSIMRNITKKWNTERKIRKNEQLFRDLFEGALDGIILWNDQGNIERANKAACEIFETSHKDLINRNITDFILKGDSKWKQIADELLKTGAIRDELWFLMPNGQKKLLEFTAKLRSADNNHMSIFRNVIERYEMEKKLRKSEQRFRKIFDGALSGMVLLNERFEIIDINEVGTSLCEKKKEELIGKSLLTVIDFGQNGKKILNKYIQQISKIGNYQGSKTLTLWNGKRKHIEYSSKYNVIPGAIFTIFQDITEKLEMEEQLRKSDTLNVIGQLAAGVAHEIRNPMTALKGFIQLLETNVKEDYSTYFNIIKTELLRIESIINEFLILAKPQAVNYLQKDIRQIMKETVELLSAQAVLHNIQFRTHYEEDLPITCCEPNQLKKVFVNIIKNAIEVMPNGGFITISIKSTEDSRIHISIRDEGSGISEVKLKKLGEPFFTTKERGMGLGLMVSYRIIEEHNGTIEVESELKKGTTFHIYLPINR